MSRTSSWPLYFSLIMWASVLAGVEPFVPDSGNSWAFPADCPDPSTPSPIDLRSWNEEVAGEHGPLRWSPETNSFMRGDGKPFVAWMVHLPHGYDGKYTKDSWSTADYRRSMRFLARHGVDLGVIGAIEPSIGMEDPLQVNPSVLDSVFKLVAAAKQAGIYVQLRAAWFQGIRAARLGITDASDHDAHCLVFFHPAAQTAWKSWVRQLLTTPNPLTGLALKDDADLCSLEIANEDSLLFWTTDGISGSARAELERQFFTWCVLHHGSAEHALAAWHGAGDPADRPAEKRLGLMITWMLTRDGRGKSDEQRVRDQLAFLIDTSRAWNAEARRFVREELGAHHLLLASSNFYPADRVLEDDALRLLSWGDMDVIEANHYVGDGGHGGPDSGWRIDKGYVLGLVSAVHEPLRLPTNKRQVTSKPFWCTEILWPRPHPYEVEGPLLVGSYQSLTGLAGLAWAGPRDITWEQRERVYFPWWNVEGCMPMAPFACSGPATVGQFPAAAAIARGGLIRRAPVAVAETRTAAQILAREEPRTSEVMSDDPNAFARDQHVATGIADGVPKESFLAGPVTVALADAPAPAAVADLAPLVRNGAVTSLTGELRMDAAHGLFTVDAPGAQVVVGFLREAGAVRLGGATIRCDLEHGTVAVVALDGRPLADSGRILVQIGARCVPTGWKETLITGSDGKPNGLRIDATGDLPWRVRRANGSVELTRCRAVRGTVLDGNGNPQAPWPVQRSGDGLRIDLPPDALYVILE